MSSDGDDVTINVTSWTNTKIDINGFTGPYGGGWTYSPGDKVEVEEWEFVELSGASLPYRDRFERYRCRYPGQPPPFWFD